MDEKKKEMRAQKKAFKKARSKAIRPWKWLTWLSAPLAIILIVATVLLSMFDNTVAVFMGGTFWELKNKDENAIYYESDFATMDEMREYGRDIVYQVEAEGAALLMNENNALPLDEGAKVSLFSSSSVDLVYGGTGSGNVDASKADNLKVAMEKSGFVVNDTLWNFYKEGPGKDYVRIESDQVTGENAKLAEVPWNVYTDEAKNSIVSYGDAAIVVLSRIGGESADCEFKLSNYLALDENEKEMMENVAAMKQAGTVKKIIVLINSANALQVDFLKNNEYGVDACLWIGDVGETGINAVTDILAGKVNPSGRLVDTYCYDNFSSPAMTNFNATIYAGYEEGIVPEHAKYYMIYQEGIYVGYKYYETRYEDFVMDKGNAGDYAYNDDVAYPFGFGLSYTTYEYSNMNVVYNETSDQFEVTVTVTNTGDVAGKETVQVYLQSPYTQYDIDNGVEKAAVALCGFGKTQMLAPGESEDVTVYVDRREFASYDTYGVGTYILDAGDYYLTVAKDAHDAVNNMLAAKGYTVETTNGRMDADGNAAFTYKWTNESFDAQSYATSLNGTKIENQLSDADWNLYEGSDSKITYLTRNDWTGTFPTETVQLALNDTLIADLQNVQYNPADYDTMEMPTMGADNGLKLYNMMGLEFDDPKWDKLLDQLTFDEMVSLIGDAFHWTMPAASVDSPGTRDENGPQGLTANLIKTKIDATALTSEDVMAATYNMDLISEVGKVVANNCIKANVALLYGPGNNIHRTPYGGRNFEYYSEDGFLSGKISTAEVMAMETRGVHVVMKHFALNDCEQNRVGLGVWVNEQAAREIYLKAFQAPVEEGNANGIMAAYTRCGTTWSGGHHGLLTNILREEWGCKGKSISDNVVVDFLNGADGLMGGLANFDAMLPNIVNQLPGYKNDPVIVNAMREACHYNLYATLNSVGMNGVGPDTEVKVVELGIITIVRTLGIAFSVLFVLSLVMWIMKNRQFKQTEAYISYQEYKKVNK